MLRIGVLLFFGILDTLLGRGGLIKSFIAALGALGLWYIPAVVSDSRGVEITAEKWKTVLAIAGVVLVVFVCSGIGTGISSSSGSVSSNTCGYCGRSWNAGDSGGNYMNIARTGLCNNCENNYHSFKHLLD